MKKKLQALKERFCLWLELHYDWALHYLCCLSIAYFIGDVLIACGYNHFLASMITLLGTFIFVGMGKEYLDTKLGSHTEMGDLTADWLGCFTAFLMLNLISLLS